MFTTLPGIQWIEESDRETEWMGGRKQEQELQKASNRRHHFNQFVTSTFNRIRFLPNLLRNKSGRDFRWNRMSDVSDSARKSAKYFRFGFTISQRLMKVSGLKWKTCELAYGTIKHFQQFEFWVDEKISMFTLRNDQIFHRQGKMILNSFCAEDSNFLWKNVNNFDS